MDFPIIRSRAGNVVTVYTKTGGGMFPVHGAYLSRSADANVWMPCTWTEEGFRRGDKKPVDLDIVEGLKEINEKLKQKEQAAAIDEATTVQVGTGEEVCGTPV